MKKTAKRQLSKSKEKSKERNDKKFEFKKFILPFTIFILFVSASIGYYMYFNTPTYQNDYEKIAYNYIKSISEKNKMPNPLAAKDYTIEDFYHIVYVAISRNQAIPVYVTNDLKFVSHLRAYKSSNDSIEAIQLALTSLNLNLPLDNLSNSLVKLKTNTSYEVYQIKENNVYFPYYFLVGKKSILLFAKKADNYLK